MPQDLLDRVKIEIGERKAHLAPFVDEYGRLEKAVVAFDGQATMTDVVDRHEARAASSKGRVIVRRRKSVRLTDEKVRDVGVELGEFNLRQLSERLGANRTTAAKFVARLTERRTFERLGGERGPNVWWRFIGDEH